MSRSRASGLVLPANDGTQNSIAAVNSWIRTDHPDLYPESLRPVIWFGADGVGDFLGWGPEPARAILWGGVARIIFESESVSSTFYQAGVPQLERRLMLLQEYDSRIVIDEPEESSSSKAIPATEPV